MKQMMNSLLIIFSIVCITYGETTLLETMQITTQPASKPGLEQRNFAPQKYVHSRLPLNGEGYYSVEGTITIDTTIRNPAIYIGSTIYPLEIFIGDRLVYRWGNGAMSKHIVDYRSTAITLDPLARGTQKFRIDFWCNGETMAMPIINCGEQTEMTIRATNTSFFNIHLLNGILVGAVFIALLFGGYYLVSGMKEREILYFSLFSITLVCALAIFPFNSQQFPEVPLFKLARVGTLFLPFWMLQFVRSYTNRNKLSLILFWVPLITTIIVSMMIIFADNTKVAVNKHFDSYGNLILMTEFLMTLIVLIRSFIVQPKFEIALIFLGFLTFISFISHDIHYLGIGILPTFWWISYGYLMLTLSMLGALIIRQRHAYESLIFLRSELEDSNSSLEKNVAERTSELQSANDKLQALDSVKSDFVSTISHELRTPLTSVLGFAQIIRKKNEEILFPVLTSTDPKVIKTKHQVQDNLDIIISEGERLTHLINDVLDIAKMEAGKTEWKSQIVDPATVVQRAVHATSSLFQKKGLRCEIEVEDALPMLVADEDRLIQVVINLLSNAVKFTDTGLISCHIQRTAKTILFSVSDTGDGIASENLNAVFEKFKQVGDILSDKPQGTGLGLPICREIIEHHGGHIWVESELHHGSTFFFELPITDMVTPEVTSTKSETIARLVTETITVEAPISTGGKTVLVVDDDQSIRELIKQELEDVGYLVIEAVDGLDAMKVLESCRPDVITIDIMMPNLNGFDLAAILKNNPETENIPIIVVSVINGQERGIKIGIDRYFTKPIDSHKLVSAVGELACRNA